MASSSSFAVSGRSLKGWTAPFLLTTIATGLAGTLILLPDEKRWAYSAAVAFLLLIGALHARFLRINQLGLTIRVASASEDASATASSRSLLESALKQIAMLQEANETVSRAQSTDDALSSLLRTAQSAIPCQTAQVLLLETPTRLFRVSEIGAKSSVAPICDPTGDAILSQVLAGNERLVPDCAAIEGSSCLPRSGSWLGVPLRVENTVIGMLALEHPSIDRFDQKDLHLARLLAPAAALAVASMRHRERAEIFRSEWERCLAENRSNSHGSQRKF
jgi:transcriptional regulator with GAF, ATPase, and Fis domain